MSQYNGLRMRFWLVSSLLGLTFCAMRLIAEEPETPLQIGDKPCELPGLHNVLRLSPRVYSGGEPAGDEAFATLAHLGIKAIVSVDGATPNVAAAKKYDLRYIHIPMGYDGVAPTVAKAVAAAMRETNGPIYFHCHRGKHRGPAAAAVGCMTESTMTNRQAVKVLDRAGTGKEYAGLWRDVAAYIYAPPKLGEKLPQLVETAPVPSLVSAMVKLDRTLDRLIACQKADWAAPKDHADRVPAQEALLAEETLHETRRNLIAGRDAAFRDELEKCELLVQRLGKTLKSGTSTQASADFSAVQQSCTECHARYRN